jgi:hypothetical protein
MLSGTETASVTMKEVINIETRDHDHKTLGVLQILGLKSLQVTNTQSYLGPFESDEENEVL